MAYRRTDDQWYVVLKKKIAQNSNLKMITEERMSSGTIFCTTLAAMLSRLVLRIAVSLSM